MAVNVAAVAPGNKVDSELVKKVTEQVIAMLAQRGLADSPTSAKPAAQTRQAELLRQGPSPQPTFRASKIFLTAEMLQQRLAASDGSIVKLASNEFLTPAAADLAERKNLTIRKAQAPLATSSVSEIESALSSVSPILAPAASECKCQTPAVGLVVVRGDDKVRAVLNGLARGGVSMTEFGKGECWMADLRSLGAAVAGGQVACGVAILPYAADAMVLASKIKGVRSVQATRRESVAAALRHYAANMLIVEHAFSTVHEMRSMIELFVRSCGGSPAYQALMTTLTELEK